MKDERRKTTDERQKGFVGKYLRLLKGRDKGTVAITFLLSLPILLTVIGVLVQYALLANAQLTLNHAVQSAARSAMTALPTDPNLGERASKAKQVAERIITGMGLDVDVEVSQSGDAVVADIAGSDLEQVDAPDGGGHGS